MAELDPLQAKAILDASQMLAMLQLLIEACKQAAAQMQQALTVGGNDAGTAIVKLSGALESTNPIIVNFGNTFGNTIGQLYGQLNQLAGAVGGGAAGGGGGGAAGAIAGLGGAAAAAGPLLLAFGEAAIKVSEYLADLAGEFANLTRQIETQSMTYGVSTDAMQVFNFEAQRLGIDTQRVSYGLRSLEHALAGNDANLTNLSGSSGKVNAILREFGLTSGSVQEKLEKLLQVLANMDDVQRRDTLTQLIGSWGMFLLPVLDQVSKEGYGPILEQMKELGVRIDDQNLKIGTEAYDANFKYNQALKGIRIELAEYVTPAYTAWINFLGSSLGNVKAAVDTFLELDKSLDNLQERFNSLTRSPLSITLPKPPGVPEGALTTTHQREIEAASEFIQKMDELKMEGEKTDDIVMKNAATIRAFKAELGNTSPQINKLANELKQATDRELAKFAAALKTAQGHLAASQKEAERLNLELNRLNNADENKVFSEQASEQEKALKQRTKDILETIKITQDGIQAQIDAGKAGAQIEEKSEADHITFLEKMHIISHAKTVEMRKDLANKIYGIEVDLTQREIALESVRPGGEKKVAELNAKLATLRTKLNADLVKIDDQGVEKSRAAFDKLFKSMGSGFQTAINGFLQGTQTFRQTWVHMVDSIAIFFVKALEKMLAMWVIHHIEKDAVSKAFSMKESLRHAWNAAKGAFEATVQIPIVGPILAPVAAAAAFASIMEMGSAAGGMVVPKDNYPAMLHAKEWVLPANITKGLQGLIEGGEGRGGMSIHSGAINIQSSANNARDLVRDLIPELQRAYRLGKI